MDKTAKLVPLLTELRQLSSQQPGFISRNTFSNTSDPGELLVVTHWEKADDWFKWQNHEKAKELQWRIDSIIGEKTIFEVYQPEEY
jgi:heme-degrading monooxygenase HmoA